MGFPILASWLLASFSLRLSARDELRFSLRLILIKLGLAFRFLHFDRLLVRLLGDLSVVLAQRVLPLAGVGVGGDAILSAARDGFASRRRRYRYSFLVHGRSRSGAALTLCL